MNQEIGKVVNCNNAYVYLYGQYMPIAIDLVIVLQKFYCMDHTTYFKILHLEGKHEQ